MPHTNGAVLALRVHASTSNLGPGFDLLGLCFSLALEVEAELGEPGGAHCYRALAGEARSWPQPRDCLLVHAYERLAGPDRPALALTLRSEIPLCRGFGSSGAAVAAGLLLGRAVLAHAVEEARLIELGVELEGHPDNSTATLLGGCTLALPHERGVRVVQAEVHPAIGMVVAWPATPLATPVARSVLPRSVPFADAVENPRRLAMLLAGLASGEPELLRLGEVDRLHASYRLACIRGGAEALAAARAAGAWLATVSGSGSGLVALGAHAAMPAIAEAMREALARHDPPAEARVVAIVREPPRLGRRAPG